MTLHIGDFSTAYIHAPSKEDDHLLKFRAYAGEVREVFDALKSACDENDVILWRELPHKKDGHVYARWSGATLEQAVNANRGVPSDEEIQTYCRSELEDLMKTASRPLNILDEERVFAAFQ